MGSSCKLNSLTVATEGKRGRAGALNEEGAGGISEGGMTGVRIGPTSVPAGPVIPDLLTLQ